jgi:hypothetical protein
VADKYVIVAKFTFPYEGELAKNLLQNEGIESFLSGEMSADALSAVSDQVLLQVHEQDAQRAAGTLAAHQASLDDDWEDKAEHDPDVWVCSLCGSPVSNRLSACLACQTPREGIRADRPYSPTDIQQGPAAPPPPDPIQKRDEVATDVSPPARPDARGLTRADVSPADEDAFPKAALSDDWGRRALIASLLSFAGMAFFLPFAWYFLARLAMFDGELSPGALRRFYLALLLSGVATVFWLGLFAWLLMWA